LKEQIIIATRGSKLALAQAGWVQAQLQGRYPQMEISLRIIKTTGDKILDVPLAQVGGKGLFTKEIEQAILDKEADLGVHSMKDVPTEIPPGLTIGVITAREDERDALISNHWKSLEDLPPGGRIGTSSLRRRAQLLHLRPDLQIQSMRGNVDTRIKKLASEQLDGIILAVAGLKRLGLAHLITCTLPITQMLPAIGQGALGLEFREQDSRIREMLAFFDDPDCHITLRAERAFLNRLEGGCQVPIAARSYLEGGYLKLEGLIGSLDGKVIIREKIEGLPMEAESLGIRLAQGLLEQGGAEILSEIYGRSFA
jgi:hydroxymethylbilane synthase